MGRRGAKEQMEPICAYKYIVSFFCARAATQTTKTKEYRPGEGWHLRCR